ncbi:MAG: MarR family transcriptional regulator [Xanthomonadales bacterium]|jgi:DNA-binding MarR family transcriptional regulator|nr:MarR family transcriptional regulator [Xanthomonadales bacterium]
MNAQDTLTALRRITRAIDLHSKRLERSAGFTVPQLLVLQSVGDLGTPSVSQLAREVHLSQGTVTAIIDRLAAKGLVERTRSLEDRRRVCVSLTDRGETSLAKAPSLLQEEFVERFSQLHSWEQKMLAASLERIAELMDAEHVDASPILETGELLTEPTEG